MTRYYFILFFFLINVVNYTSLKAQDNLEYAAPTLQIGLDGLSFGRGSLDATLILEIIAEKQQELKLKTVQNALLSRISKVGGTVYSFANNIVKELVLEKDQAIRTKKILENTVNLVFVVSWLEYYLRNLKGQDLVNFIELATHFDYAEAQLKQPLSLKSFIKKGEKRSDELAYSDSRALNFIPLLIDLSAEVVRHDKKLKELGLLQISYSSTYEYLNRYQLLRADSCKTDPKSDSLQCAASVVLADAVKESMEKSLKKITHHIGLVYYIVEHFSFRNDKLAIFNRKTLGGKAFDYVSTGVPIHKELRHIQLSIDSLIKEHISRPNPDSTLKADTENLIRIYFYLDKARIQLNYSGADKENTSVLSDVLYTIYAEFIPLLTKQSYRNARYLDLILSLNSACARLAEEMADLRLLEINDGKTDRFLLMASTLYRFNRASTISEYLKSIEDIGYLFPDDNIRNTLSIIISFVKDYTVIEQQGEGKETVSFNVEGFISKLGQIKPFKARPLQLHFTVGVNNAVFTQKQLLLPDNSTLKNLSYVSEKIGIKYKLSNPGFWKPRNPGETYQIFGKSYIKKGPPVEPIISNWHILLYGSGLLYNMVNVKTDSEFKFPMLGIGTGLTFSNALDLNLSWGIPIFPDKGFDASFQNSFINLGFDIQFIEYYERLMNRRRAQQTEKRLIEARKKMP